MLLHQKTTSNKMKSKINIFLIVVLFGCSSCADDIPSTLEKCEFEDEECMVKAWNKMTLIADKQGIPELSFPRANEHYIDKVVVNMGSDLLTLKITVRDINITGLARTTYKKVSGFKKDPKQMTGFEISGLCPYISIKGQYNGAGKFLLLQVTGDGEAEIQYFNNTFKIFIFTKTEVKDGEEYLVPTKVHSEYKSERNHFRFDNILKQKDISDAINKVANDHQDLFGKELVAPTTSAFSKVFLRIMANIFNKYPYRKFFVE